MNVKSEINKKMKVVNLSIMIRMNQIGEKKNAAKENNVVFIQQLT